MYIGSSALIGNVFFYFVVISSNEIDVTLVSAKKKKVATVNCGNTSYCRRFK